jgi:hypothetical protein
VIQISTNPGDLILDSFSGSGTTGHAVLKQNAEDGGERRFILVEMDEKIGSSSFGVDLMYTGIKSTPNDGRLHEQSGYHHLRARVAGTMGNRRPGTGHGNDTP